METGGVLSTLSKHWSSAIDLAEKDRKARFWGIACDIKRFYDSDHRFLYDGKYKSRFMSVTDADGNIPEPSFHVTVNKTAEFVNLHLPVLYHKNPNRQVTPRKPALPPELMQQIGIDPTGTQQRFAIDQARAGIMEFLLNVWPVEMDLKRESRQALTEGLVQGMGVLWCEIEEGPQGKRPGLFYEPVENLLIDPDSEQLRHAKYIIRKRLRPVCDIEYEKGVVPGTFKGKMESVQGQASVYAAGDDGVLERKAGKSADLMEYYEIYSRMGLGAKLKGVSTEMRELLDSYGDYVYLEVATNVDYPLNLPPELLESLANPLVPEEERGRMIADAIAWPTPFYKDPTWPWPFADLGFMFQSKGVWPIPILAASMGYQEFVDWSYSFMAGRLPISGRTFFACPEGQEKNITEIVLNGCDMSLVHYKANQPGQSWDQIVGFIQQPEMQKDVLTVTSAIEKKFEEATGMTQLAYGNTGDFQSRSAADVQIRQQNMSVRPDDMANKVEDWMSKGAKLQAICARAHLGPEDVAASFGEQYDMSNPEAPMVGEMTTLWLELCQAKDIDQIIGDFEYKIESGSARKPNKQAQLDQASQAVQTLLPALMPYYQQTQDPRQVNAVLKVYLDANDWTNPEEVLFPTAEQALQQQMQLQQQQMAMQQQMGMQPPMQQGQPQQQGAPA